MNHQIRYRGERHGGKDHGEGPGSRPANVQHEGADRPRDERDPAHDEAGVEVGEISVGGRVVDARELRREHEADGAGQRCEREQDRAGCGHRVECRVRVVARCPTQDGESDCDDEQDADRGCPCAAPGGATSVHVVGDRVRAGPREPTAGPCDDRGGDPGLFGRHRRGAERGDQE